MGELNHYEGYLYQRPDGTRVLPKKP